MSKSITYEILDILDLGKQSTRLTSFDIKFVRIIFLLENDVLHKTLTSFVAITSSIHFLNNKI